MYSILEYLTTNYDGVHLAMLVIILGLSKLYSDVSKLNRSCIEYGAKAYEDKKLAFELIGVLHDNLLKHNIKEVEVPNYLAEYFSENIEEQKGEQR
ncbi:MAG: hypothetical protein ACPG5B_06700 [Chitinophagales bacterium]